MPFTIDFEILLSSLNSIFGGGPILAVWNIFLAGGWVPFTYLTLKLLKFGWLQSRQIKYKAKWTFVVLAIDIPKNNEQSTKAVESIFIALAGTLSSGDFIDRWWLGKIQESYSFELCSLEGYIQFYVRTPAHFRDVIEASIYAQYPDAIIREVPDYTESAPHIFPNEEYDMWGTDFILKKSIAYPIKTYKYFEDQMTQELKDPMAYMLEALSRLGTGENFWMQMILTPTDDSWKEECEKEVQKISGTKKALKKTKLDVISDLPLKALSGVGSIVFSGATTAPPKKPEGPATSLMLLLTPGQRLTLEAIETKMSKIGFKTKMRIVYLAKKEVYNGPRGVAGFLGAIQQFTDQALNGIRPHKTFRTAKKRLFAKYRLHEKQTKVIRAYKSRNPKGGGEPYVLNTEELATIYHFPVMNVKAPLVKKSDAKRAEAPFSLPTGTYSETFFSRPKRAKENKKMQSEKEFFSEEEPIDALSESIHINGSGVFLPKEDTQEKKDPPSNLPA
jgi:hypothetical protein